MSVRPTRFLVPGILLLLVLAAAPDMAAQDSRQPRGLWGRGTIGMARLDQSCDSCTVSGTSSAGIGNFTIGYGWKGFTVGMQLAVVNDQDSEISQTLYLLTGAWYPWASSGAFVEAGIGTSSYDGGSLADGVKLDEGSGIAGQLGVGIDLAMGKLAVTPVLVVQYSAQDHTTSQALLTRSSNLTQWSVGLALGLTVF